MIDQAREWLERLHASNAPEADMALDLLGRLEDVDLVEDLERENDAQSEEIIKVSDENDALTAQLTELEEALGADGPEEAIAMARTLREAFE